MFVPLWALCLIAVTVQSSSGALSVTKMAISESAKIGHSFKDSIKYLLPHKDEISSSIKNQIVTESPPKMKYLTLWTIKMHKITLGFQKCIMY